jgi:two-component sensor histidine kinase
MTAHVLYIDDDEALRRLVEKDLQRNNFAVEVAGDGLCGVERLKSGGIDVVALDHYMPGQDGLITLEQIMALPNPPPVVFVTGTQESKVAVAALKAGAADYVIKEVEGDFLPRLRRALAAAIEARDMRQAKEHAEAEVRAARDRFEALAAERALLLREVNHRVGNSLQLIASLLHLQSGVARNQETKNALAEATGRVSAVAQVHRRLYTSDDVKAVALDQYLEGLISDLRRSAKDEAAGELLTLNAECIYAHPDDVVAVGMVVTELVINALKYAYPEGSGPIRVNLKRDGDLAVLEIEDDGVGFAGPNGGDRSEAEATEPGGLGQRIISAMAQKLKAKVERPAVARGAKVVIAFAIEKGRVAESMA